MSDSPGTLAALVDAVVPETPALAERGEEHVPGGLSVGLDGTLANALDRLQPVTGGPLALLGYQAVPLSKVVPILLDLAALELVVRRRNEDGLRRPDAAFGLGPFSRLSRRDRLRALDLLVRDGALSRVGVVRYLGQAVLTITEMAYYGEWGDEPGDGPPQGWVQAGYPGPSDGYAVHLGYEVEEFEENEY